MSLRELTPPEWTARNEEGIRAIRADGHAPPYEKEYFRKDGSRLPLIIAGTRFEDSPSEGISFLIDLSEIKRVEAALLASAQRHSYLVKLADTLRPLSDPMQVQSKASRVLGEYLVASRVVYFEIQGDDYVVERDYTAGVMPLQGRYPTKSFGPGLFADFLAGRIVSATDIKADATRPQAERDAFAAIQIDAHVTVPLVKDGVFVAGLAVHSSSPRTWTPTEIAIIEDTAQRTWASVQQARAAAALRDSEERFRTLFQTMDEGFCLAEVDLDGDGRATDYRIVEANPAFEKHTGLRGVLGQSIRRTIPGLEEFWFKAYRRLAETGEAIRFVHQAKPLSERWFDVSAFRLGGDGSQRVAILFNDISARKQGEEERERLVGQLRDADRHKDEFLATLAHELRNPLAPIRNGLQIMKLPHVDAGTVEKSRSMMERQVEQMTRLIDDLMDVSRINQGKLQLQKTRMPLADAVRNAVDTSRPLIDVQGHELVVDMPPQPIYVDGDLTRLSQVFANLLNNSAKYTDRGGRIRLAVERQGSDAVVSIADNGAGIPADMLVRVFDMFAQIDGSLEKSQGGLGIGLNIVKRLVEMHDGSITAESGGPGMGSTFNVRLPVALSVTEKRPDDQSTDEKATPTPRRRILVVDDNRDGASSLEMLLEIMGHETQTAHDGLEAVAMSEAFKPDVILMDIGMPKLNGYDACRRIREQPWAEGIVLVAMTGWGQEEDRQKSKDSGFNGHLVKPVEHVALMKLLANS